MDYVSALVPPVVMAVFFIGLIVTIVKTQGGANKSKEDAVVDAALARGERPPGLPRRQGLRRHQGHMPRPTRPASPPGHSSAYDSYVLIRFSSRTPFLLVISHYCSELCLAHWENSKTRS